LEVLGGNGKRSSAAATVELRAQRRKVATVHDGRGADDNVRRIA
jgi:hypothetical protein